METNSFVKPLREADAFHKNVSLMFDDMVASIREKTLSSTITVRHAPERQCGVWSSTNSEHKGLFVFKSDSLFRIIYVLVKVSEELLQRQGSKYKSVCAAIEIDPVIPLILYMAYSSRVTFSVLWAKHG